MKKLTKFCLSLLIAFQCSNDRQTVAEPQVSAASVTKGQQVNDQFLAQQRDIDELYKQLSQQLSSTPELLNKLKAAYSQQERRGYQLLPTIAPNASSSPPVSIQVNEYSWPRTAVLLQQTTNSFSELSLKVKDKSTSSETLVSLFAALMQQHRLVGRHVRYNQLWQDYVIRPEYKAYFDDRTQLIERAKERAALQELLKQKAPITKATAEKISSVPISGSSDKKLRHEISQRIQEITTLIRSRTGLTQVRSFLRFGNSHNNNIIVLPILTDIEDKAFLDKAKVIAEKVWRIKDGRINYQLLVFFESLPATKLYGTEVAPQKGALIDLDQHVKRFPPDHAVLTTGGASTHCRPEGICILGPEELRENSLAHEFGHFLGFDDGYFRGYRDLGADGFAILELQADPEDIMSNPGSGKVLAEHFRSLVSGTLPTK